MREDTRNSGPLVFSSFQKSSPPPKRLCGSHPHLIFSLSLSKNNGQMRNPFFWSSYTLGWLPAVSFTAWVPFLNITSAILFLLFQNVFIYSLAEREKKQTKKQPFSPYWFCQALWNPDTLNTGMKKSHLTTKLTVGWRGKKRAKAREGRAKRSQTSKQCSETKAETQLQIYMKGFLEPWVERL